MDLLNSSLIALEGLEDKGPCGSGNTHLVVGFE